MLIRYAGAAPHVRLQLTRLLHGQAETLRGQAMLYELASAAPDLLEQAQRMPTLCSVLAAPVSTHPSHAAPLSLPQTKAGSHGKAYRRESMSRPAVDVLAESQKLQVRPMTPYKYPCSLANITDMLSSKGQARLFHDQDQDCVQKGLFSAAVSQAERHAWLQNSNMRERRSSRERLPAFQQRAAFLEALAKHRVVVISGATGCGKSTQMPQYILEQARAYRLLYHKADIT